MVIRLVEKPAPTMHTISDWLREKRSKHAAGRLTDADFEELQALLSDTPRQQLLYLQATSTSPLSRVVGAAHFVPGERHDDYTLDPSDFPYETVMQAVEEGWRIVQFPVPPTGFSDQGLDYLGFEFVLERYERAHRRDAEDAETAQRRTDKEPQSRAEEQTLEAPG
jgi:hypothetical protein